MISTYRADPRTKLATVLFFSTISLIYEEIWVLVLILFLSAMTALAMKSSLVAILVRLRKLLGVMAAIAIVQSIFTNTGSPIAKIGDITLLTDYGAAKALEFILRLGIIIVSAAIITTSSSREIVQGLVQWHCPYEIAFMTSVAIRFLPLFKEEMSDMVTAIQLRGIDLKRVKFREKIKIYKYILFPVVINSVLKAKELSSAMVVRGFRAYPQRTSYMILKMNFIDYFIVASLVAVSIIITVLYI